MQAEARVRMLELEQEYWTLMREWDAGRRTIELNEKLAKVAAAFQEQCKVLEELEAGRLALRLHAEGQVH